ncbi:hypothetical protein diail_9022 [Diaporthe ilicicola]|nr:hypothetical protein diail_9022 [Diaporthe ilicicola]
MPQTSFRKRGVSLLGCKTPRSRSATASPSPACRRRKTGDLGGAPLADEGLLRDEELLGLHESRRDSCELDHDAPGSVGELMAMESVPPPDSEEPATGGDPPEEEPPVAKEASDEAAPSALRHPRTDVMGKGPVADSERTGKTSEQKDPDPTPDKWINAWKRMIYGKLLKTTTSTTEGSADKACDFFIRPV